MEAPYPAETRAKGWRFDLDYERIRQSDTWTLASAELRPWLLMLWMTAWEQVPCGALPADDELVAARIGMPLDLFMASRRVLMRGWHLADDGRLYHPVLTERVLDMFEKRQKDAIRKGNSRAGIRASHNGVTRDAGVTPPGVHAPTPTPTPTEEETQTALTRDPASRKPRKPKLTTLPEKFAVSDRVRRWAAEKGHVRLDEHFEYFVSYARRKGATYADWDEALMTAIRENWGKLSTVVELPKSRTPNAGAIMAAQGLL